MKITLFFYGNLSQFNFAPILSQSFLLVHFNQRPPGAGGFDAYPLSTEGG